MRRLRQTLAALLGALVFGHAGAIVLITSTVPPGSAIVDASAPGLLSFDLDLGGTPPLAPITLLYELEATDIGSPPAFSVLLRNFLAEGVPQLVFTLDAGSFSLVGSVIRPFGGTSQVGVAGGTAGIVFTPAEFFEAEIGDVFGTTAGASPWQIDFGGFGAGQPVQLVIEVPELPPSALLLVGLLVGGALRAGSMRSRPQARLKPDSAVLRRLARPC